MLRYTGRIVLEEMFLKKGRVAVVDLGINEKGGDGLSSGMARVLQI